MTSFVDNLDPKKWEKFCERMLRNHYGNEVFFPVTDEDSGDRGIEFYTNTGLIFQCYYPGKKYEMKEYKRKIQKKN